MARREDADSGGVFFAGPDGIRLEVFAPDAGTGRQGPSGSAPTRGGDPGFVQVAGPASLRWPGFPGNNMFATLGNLEVDPAAGLLFIDWERGRTLQLAGRARVTAEGRRPAHRVRRRPGRRDRRPAARRRLSAGSI